VSTKRTNTLPRKTQPRRCTIRTWILWKCLCTRHLRLRRSPDLKGSKNIITPRYHTLPRHLGTFSSPTFPHLSSVSPSSYTGLTEKQLKKLKNAFEKTDTKAEYLREIFEMVAIDMTENIIELVGEWADEKPDVRTFSKLTTHDHRLLCKSIHNDIDFNNEILHQKIPDSIISPGFLPMLHISRLVSSKKYGNGHSKSHQSVYRCLPSILLVSYLTGNVPSYITNGRPNPLRFRKSAW